MSKKTIYDIAREFDEALARDERPTLLRLTTAYGEVWKALRQELDANLRRMAEARAAGLAPTPAAIRTDARLRALLDQVEERIQAWARDVAGATEALQAIGADLGQRYTQGVLGLSLGEHARVLGVFDRLPASAIQAMVGFTSDGSPLADLFASFGADVRAAWERLLVAGIATGRAPVEVARQARQATGQALWRATRIARTEMLRAYREAAAQTAGANEAVLAGWYWGASLSVRTCPACLAMHGTFHPVAERLVDHPNGRCVQIWQIKPYDALGIEGGTDARAGVPDAEAWLRSLPSEQQEAIFGKQAAQLWRDGQVRLRDFATPWHDKWGDSYRVTTLRELQAGSRGNATLAPLRRQQLEALGEAEIARIITAVRSAATIPKPLYHFEKHGKSIGATSPTDYVHAFREHLQSDELTVVTYLRPKDRRPIWELIDEVTGNVVQYDEPNSRVHSFFRVDNARRHVEGLYWLIRLTRSGTGWIID